MNKIITFLLILSSYQLVQAQESYHDYKKSLEEKKGDAPVAEGFDKSKIFVGGGLSLGYGTTQDGNNSTNSTFNIGAIPEIGYSLSNLVDVGISTSINYTTTTNSFYDSKLRYTTYSLGVFARIYPLNNFFIQLMPEQDWGRQKIVTPTQTYITKIKSNSFLAGVGFGQRVIGETYFYTLILVDLGKDRYSPYNYYNPYTGTVSLVPIIRGGISFYPFRKHEK